MIWLPQKKRIRKELEEMNGTCLEAALKYAAKGWSVIPLLGKVPPEGFRSKPFQKRIATEKEIRQWWDKWPTASVGIVLGKVSGGLAVLDVDEYGSPLVEQLIKDLKGKTLLVRSPKGGLHIYLIEDATSRRKDFRRLGVKADLQANGQHVVAAPSEGYSVISDGPILHVNNARQKAFELLQLQDVKKQETSNSVREEAAIGEGERNDVLFHFSCVLRDRNYRSSDALGVMKKIARSACIPPYAGEKEDKELENTVSSAFSQAPLTRSTGSSQGYSLLPNVVIHSCEEKESNVSVETDWLWKGYVAKGLITLLSSDSYGGKTTLVFHLLREMFALQPFLGQPTNLKGGVLVLTEEPEHLFTDRLRDLGLTKSPITWIHHYQLFGASGDVLLETVRKHIEENKIELVIVDTLSSFSQSEDENDAVETRKGVRPFERMAHELKTGLIIFHHLNAGYGDRGQEPRGSTALKGVSHIELKMKYGGEEFQRKLIARSKVFNRLPDDLVIELKKGDYQVIGNATKMTKAKTRQRCKDALEEKPMEIEKLKRKNPSLPSHVRLKKILDECVKEGDGVGRKGNGLRGHAWAYYRQKEKDDTSVIHTSTSNMNLNNADLKSGKAKV